MGDRRTFSVPQLLAVVIVLAGAVAAGVAIRNIVRAERSLNAPIEAPPKVVVPIVTPVREPSQPVARGPQRYEPAEDVNQPVEQPVERAQEPAEVKKEDKPAVTEADDEPTSPASGQGDGRELFKNAFDNLDLSPEEGARLGEAIKRTVERYNNLGEVDRRDQMMQLRRQREQWDQMDESQKRQWTQDLRGQFEDWRRSGSAELPESISYVLVIQMGQFAGDEIPKYFDDGPGSQ